MVAIEWSEEQELARRQTIPRLPGIGWRRDRASRWLKIRVIEWRDEGGVLVTPDGALRHQGGDAASPLFNSRAVAFGGVRLGSEAKESEGNDVSCSGETDVS